MKVLFYPTLPDFRNDMLFGMFPCKEQQVDENEYGALVK
jgi:hypothetical protein